jgi:hypothetical protein
MGSGFITVVVLLLERSPGPSGPPQAALQLQAVEGQAQGVGDELRSIDVNRRAEQVPEGMQAAGQQLALRGVLSNDPHG